MWGGGLCFHQSNKLPDFPWRMFILLPFNVFHMLTRHHFLQHFAHPSNHRLACKSLACFRFWPYFRFLVKGFLSRILLLVSWLLSQEMSDILRRKILYTGLCLSDFLVVSCGLLEQNPIHSQGKILETPQKILEKPRKNPQKTLENPERNGHIGCVPTSCRK